MVRRKREEKWWGETVLGCRWKKERFISMQFQHGAHMVDVFCPRSILQFFLHLHTLLLFAQLSSCLHLFGFFFPLLWVDEHWFSSISNRNVIKIKLRCQRSLRTPKELMLITSLAHISICVRNWKTFNTKGKKNVIQCCSCEHPTPLQIHNKAGAICTQIHQHAHTNTRCRLVASCTYCITVYQKVKHRQPM